MAKKKASAKKTTRKATAKKTKKKVARKKTAKKKTAKKKAVKKAAVKKKPAKKKKSTRKKAAKKRAAEKPVQPELPFADSTATSAPPTQSVTTTHNDDRSIGVGRDAIGNAIITGDGNIVVVQTGRLAEAEPTPPESTSESSVDYGNNPYMGLLAFHESDADRFFGREQQVARLWELFRDLHEPPAFGEEPLRLLPVLGPSGSGKSSVARAGLIPELARRPLPGLNSARVAVLTPGSHPLESLAGVLAKIATNDQTPVAKTREFASEMRHVDSSGQHDGLRRIAATLPDIASTPLIVLVDQFEECYSLCSDIEERQTFVECLLNASADQAAHVSVIITLRTDFLDETQKHPILNAAIAKQGAIIPAMNESELRMAITEPARLAGHPLEDATVD